MAGYPYSNPYSMNPYAYNPYAQYGMSTTYPYGTYPQVNIPSPYSPYGTGYYTPEANPGYYVPPQHNVPVQHDPWPPQAPVTPHYTYPTPNTPPPMATPPMRPAPQAHRVYYAPAPPKNDNSGWILGGLSALALTAGAIYLGKTKNIKYLTPFADKSVDVLQKGWKGLRNGAETAWQWTSDHAKNAWTWIQDRFKP
ncbi:MAG: hypothetical protein HEQ32_02115 [Vampirovibrio sp.]